MSANYVIKWKSKVNGRAGRGTKEFEQREAERLVEELNREYPDIQHELCLAQPSATQSSEAEPITHNEPEEQSPSRPIHAYSFK